VRTTKNGTVLDVFVQPRAPRDAIVGVHGDALKLKVRALPAGGRANRAAIELIAETIGIAPSQVELTSGTASRHKRFRISGVSAEKVACELTTVLSSRAHEPGQEDN
jgi:uncharacterized protein (TIGR00251 family)